MYLTFNDFTNGTACLLGHTIISERAFNKEKFNEVLYLSNFNIAPHEGILYVVSDHLVFLKSEAAAFFQGCGTLNSTAMIVKASSELLHTLEENPQWKQCMIIAVTPSELPSELIAFELLRRMNHFMQAMFQNVTMINADFFRMSLKNSGIEAMIQYFKEVIGNPVAIFDEAFQCIAATDECLRTHGRISSVSENIHLNNLYFSKQKIILDKSQEYPLISFPISYQGKVRAYLSILELSNNIIDIDYLVLEIAASSILMEMKHALSIKTIQERNVNKFLYDLFHRNDKDLEDFYNLSIALGFEPNIDFFVTVVEARASSAKSPAPRTLSNILQPTISDEILSLIASEMNATKSCILLGQLGNSVIALCEVMADPAESFSAIKKAMEKAGVNLRKYFNNSVLYSGIGSVAHGIDEAVESYNHARSSIVYAKVIAKSGDDMSVIYEDNMLIKLLSSVGSREALNQMIPKSLCELQTYDGLHQTQLVMTLSTYFDCDCNARLAAEIMFVHYKTLLYRLGKITEICGFNFSDSNEKMQLTLGITILKLLQSGPFENTGHNQERAKSN